MNRESMAGPVRSLTLALCAVGATAVLLAGQLPGRSLIPDVVQQGVVLAGIVFLKRWQARKPMGPMGQLVVLVGLFLVPFLLGAARRSDRPLPALADPLRDLPLELRMLQGLSHVGLALGVFGLSARHARLAAIISLFNVLFAASIQERDSFLPWLVVLFAAVGSAWLLLWYWTGLNTQADTPPVRLPWPALAAVSLVVGMVAGASALNPTGVRRALAEWLPSSGGTGEYHAGALSGVGDGEDEAAGDNPESVGFAESDTFLEDEGPSLYDVLSDMYGKAHKVKERQHMIPLGLEKVAMREKHPKVNLRAGREFPVQRQPRTGPRDLPGSRTKALLFVQGRTPLHLALTAYDRFDGASLHPAPYCEAGACVVWDAREKAFYALRPRRAVFHDALEKHTLKLALLNEEHLPTPIHFKWFRVGKIARADFFAWAQEDILRMAQRKPPRGTVLGFRSLLVDRRRLRDMEFDANELEREKAVARQGIPGELTALSDEWAGNAAGWARVEAIVQRLRQDYEHDPRAGLGSSEKVSHFLFQSRRGPDYLFAVSAALLVRAQGFPTRVVGGLYARPDRFDPAMDHTPVLRDDGHFWTEVRLPTGDWIAIEPTPGYELLEPRPGWAERFGLFLRGLGAAAARHKEVIGGMVILLALLVCNRRRLLDGYWLWRWHGERQANERRLVLATFGFLERRARSVGCPRPRAMTPLAWASVIAPSQDPLRRLALLVEAAAYAPATHSLDLPRGELEALCRETLRTWSLSAFRLLARRPLARPPLARPPLARPPLAFPSLVGKGLWMTQPRPEEMLA